MRRSCIDRATPIETLSVILRWSRVVGPIHRAGLGPSDQLPFEHMLGAVFARVVSVDQCDLILPTRRRVGDGASSTTTVGSEIITVYGQLASVL